MGWIVLYKFGPLLEDFGMGSGRCEVSVDEFELSADVWAEKRLIHVNKR